MESQNGKDYCYKQLFYISKRILPFSGVKAGLGDGFSWSNKLDTSCSNLLRVSSAAHNSVMACLSLHPSAVAAAKVADNRRTDVWEEG